MGEGQDYEDHYDDDGDCWQCGGEGFVSNCFEDFACLDPEGGCDLCTRRCDLCNNPTPKQKQEAAELSKILGDAIHAAKGDKP